MTAKHRKWDTRTILAILLVILIITAIAYFVLSYEGEPRFYSVEEVLTNKDQLLNDEIIVKGELYSPSPDGYPYSLITPTTDPNPEPSRWLNLDTSDVANVTTELSAGTTYKIKGRLVKDYSDPFGIAVIFIVSGYKLV